MRLLDHIEVGAKVVLLVLFLESLAIAEVRMNPNQDLEQAGRLRRAPPLLSEDDLVAAAHARAGLDFNPRRMSPRPCREKSFYDQGDLCVDSQLGRAGCEKVGHHRAHALR